MTTAAALLREARGGTGRTQADLERLSGVRQTAISRAERGHQDLTVAALERLVHAAGWRVTVLPTQAGSVADAADACRQYLAVGSEDGAYRAVIQLADWLGSEHGAERVALTVTPPAPTEQWFVDLSSADDPAITAATPPALLARGVVIDVSRMGRTAVVTVSAAQSL